MPRAIVVLVLTSALWLGTTGVAAGGLPAKRGEPTVETALEGRLLERINDVRVANGLRPLHPAAGLERSASTHARWLGRSGSFTHASADGTSPAVRIRRFYDGRRVGEALLWRSPSVEAADAVDRWLASPSHRALLLGPAFRQIGLAAVHVEAATGVYGGLDVTVLVADFGTPR